MAYATSFGSGTVDVKATFMSLQSTTQTVTISRPPFPMYVWPDTNVLFAGMTRTLTTQIDDPLDPLSSVPSTWRSVDPSVAVVDDSGRVAAVAVGQTKIIATSSSGVDTAEVYVVADPPTLRFATASGFANHPFRYLPDGSDTYARGCGLGTDGGWYCWGQPFAGLPGPFDRCEYRHKTGPGNRFAFVRFRCGEIPRRVAPTVNFVSANSECALSTEGVAYCKGVPVNTPERFLSLGSYPYIYNNEYTACGLRADGALFCWGSNWAGSAGADPATATVATPTRVGTRTYSSLGHDGACALAADSTAYCWGQFVGGPCADPTANTACSPTPIQAGTARWAVVDGHSWPRCALNASSRVYCAKSEAPAYSLTPTLVSDEPVTFAGTRSSTMVVLDSRGSLRTVTQDFNTKVWSLTAFDPVGVKLKQVSWGCGTSADGKAYCQNIYGNPPTVPWILVPGQ